MSEILQPDVVGARLDAFTATEVPDGSIRSEPFQDDADSLFGAELAAGKALDLVDELSVLFASGFSLPELTCPH